MALAPKQNILALLHVNTEFFAGIISHKLLAQLQG
jgi:hypothetical protein